MRWLKIISLVFLFQSCGEKEVKKDEDILSKQKMKELIFDVILANSTANIQIKGAQTDSIAVIYNQVYRDSIYAKHGVDDNIFQKNYKYYFTDNEKLEPLMNAIMDSLSAYENEINKKQPSN